MAPEQVRGEIVTAATDAWGLGAVLPEMVTGHFACHDEEGSAAEVTESRGDSGELCVPIPVRSWRRLPRHLAQVIDRCLMKSPAERPTLPEIHAELEQYLGGPPATSGGQVRCAGCTRRLRDTPIAVIVRPQSARRLCDEVCQPAHE